MAWKGLRSPVIQMLLMYISQEKQFVSFCAKLFWNSGGGLSGKA